MFGIGEKENVYIEISLSSSYDVKSCIYGGLSKTLQPKNSKNKLELKKKGHSNINADRTLLSKDTII